MKTSKAFDQTFLSAPQLNAGNSGKGSNGNYKRPYSKTAASISGKPKAFAQFPHQLSL